MLVERPARTVSVARTPAAHVSGRGLWPAGDGVREVSAPLSAALHLPDLPAAARVRVSSAREHTTRTPALDYIPIYTVLL